MKTGPRLLPGVPINFSGRVAGGGKRRTGRPGHIHLPPQKGGFFLGATEGFIMLIMVGMAFFIFPTRRRVRAEGGSQLLAWSQRGQPGPLGPLGPRVNSPRPRGHGFSRGVGRHPSAAGGPGRKGPPERRGREAAEVEGPSAGPGPQRPSRMRSGHLGAQARGRSRGSLAAWSEGEGARPRPPGSRLPGHSLLRQAPAKFFHCL